MTDPRTVAMRLMGKTCYDCEHFLQAAPDKDGHGLCDKSDWNCWATDVGCDDFLDLRKNPDHD